MNTEVDRERESVQERLWGGGGGEGREGGVNEASRRPVRSRAD